jgi:tetratricopeptide (TPR) repeat protein
MTKILEAIQKFLLYTAVVLFPVFVLSIFSNPFIIPKEVLLIVLSSVAILVWIIKIIIKGEMSFAVGKFDLGVLLVTIAYLLSAILKTPNKFDAFLLPGTATIVIASGIFYFLLNQLDRKGKDILGFTLLISSVVLSISILLIETGILGKDRNFNAFGGFFPSIVYLAITFIFSIGLLVKHNDFVKRLFISVSLVIVVLGVVVSIKNILPGKPQALALSSFQTSWVVAVEALKASPILGVGPANYLSAFNMFKPLSYNQTDLWQVRFTSARNFYLTVLTETGFAGIIAVFILLVGVYKSLKHKLNIEKISLVILLIIFALLPITSILITLLFVLLSVVSGSEDNVTHITLNTSSRIPSIIMTLPVLAAIIALAFFGTKTLAAEITFQKALVAASKNDAKTTYDLMQKTISQNPQIDRYHASFAQVNMALASSLAAKKDITEDDKKTVSQLIQQAINEGKNTAILNPDKSGNWELLAGIYKQVMPFAQGADNFAIQTYNQAIALDPINPNLRISLGGVYYALGRYDEAIEAFKLAVLAKQDFPNAHYNLAVAYREKKDITKATEEMNKVLSLVGKNSADYELAKKELEKLESLTTPQPAEKSNIKPPIELPQEATPPVSL